MRIIIIILFLGVSLSANAQITGTVRTRLRKFENDTLKQPSRLMVFDTIPGRRFAADSIFIRLFVKALKEKNSFDYPFDSINTISKIYPPDSSFRIFTWELQRDEGYYRQQGAIQMKTADGSLKLYPLLDQSDFAINPTDSARSAKNWIGAIYYGIVAKEYKSKKYYMLFGFDDNDFASSRKWVDVLTFNPDGSPLFGANIFDYKNDSLKAPQPAYRFLLEYKKDARAKLVYDPELQMIVFDHLTSETGNQQNKYSLIPDGSYEGFTWKNGKWVHVDDIFANMPQDGKTPTPQPVYDANGNPIKE